MEPDLRAREVRARVLKLEPDTEVLYKVSTSYSPERNRGLLWCDPALGIDWPVSAEQVVISDKDRKHPPLSQLSRFFQYEETSASLRG